MKPSDDVGELIAMIEQNREKWLKTAPLASNLRVATRSESLTIRLTKEEDEALKKTAQELGIGKSSVVRIILRQALGLSKSGPHAASSKSGSHYASARSAMIAAQVASGTIIVRGVVKSRLTPRSGDYVHVKVADALKPKSTKSSKSDRRVQAHEL